MTNLETAVLTEETAVVPALSTKEQMEAQMTMSWSELDAFFSHFQSGTPDTAGAWSAKWASNKEAIFKAWGNKLRIEKDVELSVSENDVQREMIRLINRLADKANEAEAFVKSSTIQAVAVAIAVVGYQDVLENKLSKELKLFNQRFGKGMKLSKVLGKLCGTDKERDIVQTEYSMSAQTFKASGKVVMSIDPFDILTMSWSPDNEWRSCHHIIDGEFRAGAVSYVLDPSTFISYVYKTKSAHKYTNGVEIPNKSWRVMGYMSPNNFIALSTHYPSTNKSNRVTLVDMIAETMGDGTFNGGMIHEETYYEYDMFDNYGGMHYNDITEGRISKFYMIDPHSRIGVSGNEFESHVLDFMKKEQIQFTVGVPSVTSVLNDGEIEDADRIDTDCGDYDDDDW